MSDSLAIETKLAFVCEYDDWHGACAGEPFYAEHQGKQYCVLHFPAEKDDAKFKEAFQRKLDNKNFKFHRVWFPAETSFSGFKFSETTTFDYATFNGPADFSKARFTSPAAPSFSYATFKAAADFSHVTFEGGPEFSHATFTLAANFNNATLGRSDFSDVTFLDAALFYFATFNGPGNFRGARFNGLAHFEFASFVVADFGFATFNAEVDFRLANFEAPQSLRGAAFRSTTFRDYVRFEGNKDRTVFPPPSSLDLQFARMASPNNVSFHTLRLRPHWFVNVDARGLQFTNIDWDWSGVRKELAALDSYHVVSPHRMLSIACQQLAVNAEDNNRYEEASWLRYVAMDARRREVSRGFAFWRLSWWYWLASGYGERMARAFVVLLGILFLFAFLYTRVGFVQTEPKLPNDAGASSSRRDESGVPLKFSRALMYSAGVMTLQKPEPRPATIEAQTIVLFETILGPVQAALLALAIRRKFMR